MNKLRKLSVLLSLVISLTSCGLYNNSTSVDEKDEIISVEGSNLASSNNINVNDEIMNYEDLLIETISYAYNATVCVLNYQTVKMTYIENNGPWPSYSTKEEHTLYGMGSGVIYYKSLTSEGTYFYKLITNEHVIGVDGDESVVQGKEEYKIYDERYEEEIICDVVGMDVENDIAILSFVSTRNYTAVTFLDESKVIAGKQVIAIGTPLDIEYYNTATCGIISRKNDKYIQHDAAINSGNSGGPLFDIYGNLVGINNAKLSGVTSSGVSIEGLYFAIPLNMVEESIIEITKVNDIIYSN